MHPEATDFVIHAIQTYGPFERVLEVGSRDVNGTIKHHFLDHGTKQYVGVDLEEGPNVTVVVDFSKWAMELEPWLPVDAVVCVNVLEHTPEGEGIFKNAYRALDAGGIFIMSAAYAWAPHGAFDGGLLLEAEHYANVTPGQVEYWTEQAGFHPYRWEIKMHDIQFLGWK